MQQQTKNGRIYQKERSIFLDCPKCHKPVDYLLGEEEYMACEECYTPPQNPKQYAMPTQTVGEESVTITPDTIRMGVKGGK